MRVALAQYVCNFLFLREEEIPPLPINLLPTELSPTQLILRGGMCHPHEANSNAYFENKNPPNCSPRHMVILSKAQIGNGKSKNYSLSTLQETLILDLSKSFLSK